MPAQPEYEFWFSRDLWSLSEAICLLLNRTPTPWLQGKARISPSRLTDDDVILRHRYARLHLQAKDAIDIGKLKPKSKRHGDDYDGYYFRPADFLNWADDKEISVPEELQDCLRQLRSQPQRKERQSTRIKEACQTVAEKLWEANPRMTIKEMATAREIFDVGAGSYGEQTRERWIREVDPRPPQEKRGRPRKGG
jgi:hypothetical protein